MVYNYIAPCIIFPMTVHIARITVCHCTFTFVTVRSEQLEEYGVSPRNDSSVPASSQHAAAPVTVSPTAATLDDRGVDPQQDDIKLSSFGPLEYPKDHFVEWMYGELNENKQHAHLDVSKGTGFRAYAGKIIIQETLETKTEDGKVVHTETKTLSNEEVPIFTPGLRSSSMWRAYSDILFTGDGRCYSHEKHPTISKKKAKGDYAGAVEAKMRGRVVSIVEHRHRITSSKAANCEFRVMFKVIVEGDCSMFVRNGDEFEEEDEEEQQEKEETEKEQEEEEEEEDDEEDGGEPRRAIRLNSVYSFTAGKTNIFDKDVDPRSHAVCQQFLTGATERTQETVFSNCRRVFTSYLDDIWDVVQQDLSEEEKKSSDQMLASPATFSSQRAWNRVRLWWQECMLGEAERIDSNTKQGHNSSIWWCTVQGSDDEEGTDEEEDCEDDDKSD